MLFGSKFIEQEVTLLAETDKCSELVYISSQ